MNIYKLNPYEVKQSIHGKLPDRGLSVSSDMQE